MRVYHTLPASLALAARVGFFFFALAWFSSLQVPLFDSNGLSLLANAAASCLSDQTVVHL